MMRSMFSGVSGLKAHQTRMDVIGNNISNVNTAGYKGSRVTFKEMLSQTLQGAKSSQNGQGGINPKQVGLGVGLGSIDTNLNQGNLQSTGIGTDLAIEGSGYFVVSDGQQNFYTRVGALTPDENGSLINAANGYIMQGWMADASGMINTNKGMQGIRIPIGETMSGQASKEAVFAGNFDSRNETGADHSKTATIDVFDSLGNIHTVSIDFEKDADNNWKWTINDVSDAENVTGSGTIAFKDDGTIIADGNENVTITFDPGSGAAAGQNVNIDFSQLTQMAGEYTVDGLMADGYAMGDLKTFSIDSAGVITGGFSNGLTKSLGQIAIANFSNPSGLSRTGDTLFVDSQNSGMPQIGVAGSGGRGNISAGNLEMSNVDLAEQFTDMISTQRGFQANSKIITTADQMLQDLVNLKR